MWTSLVTQTVKTLPAMQETWVQSLSWADPLEKGIKKKMPLGFDRDCTGSVDCLGHCGHFTNINSSNQEHISFHLFLSTLISFINI